MTGLELSKRFYEECGAPMIRELFPELEGLIAVGLSGSGSECFGYDDIISRDHDFEPGFCIFLPNEKLVDRKAEFELERAYSRLPKEFMGFKRSPLSPVGGNRHGVIRIGSFFKDKTGKEDASLSSMDWFFVPEQSLAEATNGKVFRDDLGVLTAIRERLSYFPDDVRLKKLGGHLLTMAQAGQYNYARCTERGETAAAQLAAVEFVKSALCAVFLINKKYIPYYKWSFRALRDLELLSELYSELEYLISTPNTSDEIEHKKTTIEDVSRKILLALHSEGIIKYTDNETEKYAYEVNNRISDGNIRNLHILYAI